MSQCCPASLMAKVSIFLPLSTGREGEELGNGPGKTRIVHPCTNRPTRLLNQQHEQGQGQVLQGMPLPPVAETQAAECRGESSGPCPSASLQQLLWELPSTIVLPGHVPRNLYLQGWMVVVGEAFGDSISNRRLGIGWDGNGDEIGTEWV